MVQKTGRPTFWRIKNAIEENRDIARREEHKKVLKHLGGLQPRGRA